MTVNKKLFVNFDGLCEPANPAGIPCYGFVVKDENATLSYRSFGVVNSVRPFSPESNSNAAEFGGAIKALEWLIENSYANHHDNYEILVRGDCELITRKLKNRAYSPRAARLNPMYDRAVMLRSKFDPDSIRFEWIQRDQNREADELAKEAYYWALRRYPELRRKVREHWTTMLWLEQMIHKEQSDCQSTTKSPQTAHTKVWQK